MNSMSEAGSDLALPLTRALTLNYRPQIRSVPHSSVIVKRPVWASVTKRSFSVIGLVSFHGIIAIYVLPMSLC